MTHSRAEIRSGLSYAEAVESALALVEGQTTDKVMVSLEAALGCALAANVVSPVALPPWDNSAMDGFAVRRADVLGASPESPIALSIIGNSIGGSDPAALPAVLAGTAVRTMTGAPIAPGADAVVRVEDTVAQNESGQAQVLIVNDRDTQGHGNIRGSGEDIARGAQVLGAGTTIRSAHLGLLASVGCAEVFVYRAPRVTIISSGDELVTLEAFNEVVEGKRIVSSTSYALPALLRSAGAQVTMAPLVTDSLDAMTRAMSDAIENRPDLLITTGGISVGDYDYTRNAFEALGGVQQFWRAKIRPGGPIGAGVVNDIPWIGLPGNPVSTLVTALLFAWPVLRKLAGHNFVHHMPFSVRATSIFETPAPLTHFLRVRLNMATDGQIEATSAGPQGSHIQHSMAFADALMIAPEDTARVEPGMVLPAILIPDFPPHCNSANFAGAMHTLPSMR